MKIKICVNPACGLSNSELSDIALTDALKGEIIYRGRNLIKLVHCDPYPITIKCFSQSFKNRLIYAIRRSKARRSYENALELIRRGFDTPLPYGYIESRRYINTLSGSYYICRYEERLSLYDAILAYGHNCLAAFATYVVSLHINGIRHDDLNNSNVRVHVDSDGEFHFSLIDLNRMKIYRNGKIVPKKECFKNICRFCELGNYFFYFVMKYVEARNMPPEKAERAIAIKRKFDKRVAARKWFKQHLLLSNKVF